MRILINHREVCLKAGTSFQFVAENRAFTGSDSYTLTIELPLAGCRQNLDVFGHLERTDVKLAETVYDCDIIDRDFRRSGVVTVTELSDVTVKVQFLEGRSAQNFDSLFDTTYINELPLGLAPKALMRNTQPADCWRVERPEEDFVALPWVYEASGNIQNAVTYDKTTQAWRWSDPTGSVSFMPYLICVAGRIFDALGYTFDCRPWQASPLSWLLVCNALPGAWDRRQVARILPRWTVTEFVRQLELLLAAELDVNHKTKTVTFSFTDAVVSSIAPVRIDRIVDEYTADVSRESEADSYAGLTNLAYADAGHALSAYYACDWYIRQAREGALVYDTLDELMAKARTLEKTGVTERTGRPGVTFHNYYRGYPPGSDGNRLLYARDVDTYFIMKCRKAEVYRKTDDFTAYTYYFEPCPVNQFGPLILDEEHPDETEEIGMVPACIDETDDVLGPCLFLAPSGFEAVAFTDDDTQRPQGGGRFFGTPDPELDEEYYNNGGLAYSGPGLAIRRGQKESDGEYYSHISLGFWDGTNPFTGLQPRPLLDKVTIAPGFKYYAGGRYSLRLTGRLVAAQGERVEAKRKYHFAWISDTLPNPRAVYYIHGQRFVCEKITATFSERGMSQLLKGEFFMIDDAT